MWRSGRMYIDVEQLREDMEEECYGEYFGGGFGGAMAERAGIKEASDEELIKMAQRRGVNLDRYSR